MTTNAITNIPDMTTENPDYLKQQIITYLGNKRKLLPQIETLVQTARDRVGGRQLSILDLYSGSGVVARMLKKHSYRLQANDMSDYSRILSLAYLANHNPDIAVEVDRVMGRINMELGEGATADSGFIRELYTPRDPDNIVASDRAFYTPDNGRRIDYIMQQAQQLPAGLRIPIMARLLVLASAHASTMGHFRAFMRDKQTGLPKLGGNLKNDIERVNTPITLTPLVYSNFTTAHVNVFQEDANILAANLPFETDLVYMDPPYNEVQYGSMYFMLDLIASGQPPQETTPVTGLNKRWRRSAYNTKSKLYGLLKDVIQSVPARFIVLSYSNDGYIMPDKLYGMLAGFGRVDVVTVAHRRYNTGTSVDNVGGVGEFLFLLDRQPV